MPTKPKRLQNGSPRITIIVDEETIATSKRADSSHCMIADAVREAVPTAQYVTVDLATIRWSDPKQGKRYTYLTPRKAQTSLLKFDQGEEVIEPFAFELRDAMVTETAGATKVRGVDASPLPRQQARVKQNTRHGGVRAGTREGGKTPPLGALVSRGFGNLGKRREFGLRATVK